MIDEIPPAVQVLLVIEVRGIDARRIPLRDALALLSTALAENGNDPDKAQAALVAHLQRAMAQI